VQRIVGPVSVMAMGATVDEPRIDPVDFETWVSARVPAFLPCAYLVTGNRHDAQDAVQDALASACAKWPRVSASHDIDAYVRRMIANAHISRWRRTRRRETLVADVSSNALGRADSADDGPDVGDTDEMWQACLALPRQQRVALVLRYYEDLSFAQIAAILDCAEPTARSHVHRGLAGLRRVVVRVPDEGARDR
jgi:RNA polymerase sigma-70 factor (sigma-E family)